VRICTITKQLFFPLQVGATSYSTKNSVLFRVLLVTEQ